METQDSYWSVIRETMIGFYYHWEGLFYVAFILFITLAVTLVVHVVLRVRHRHPGTSRHIWRNAVIGALNAPLQAIAWIVGVSFVEEVLTAGGHMPLVAELFPPVRDVVAVGIIAWFLVRLSHQLVLNMYRRAQARGRDFDTTAADAINKFVTAAIVIIALMVIMQTLGFSIASLLTFGGVAGIALGFAAQGLVSNLLGGITIYTSRPFKVGENVVFSGGSLMGQSGYIGWQAGEVQHIGWRATRILDWNGKPFYVPNSKFNTETIINHSRMAYRELSEYVYLRLEDIDKVAAITTDVNHMLQAHPEIGDYLVFKFDGYGEYALKLYLYAYTIRAVTAYTEFMRVKQDILLKIAAIIAENGANLAVPVSTVRVPGGLALRHEDGADGVGVWGGKD